jgi:ATP-binding cassette subfamily B protein/ATP-binding cassette subfamily C protein
MTKKKKLPARRYVRAVVGVATLSFRTAPRAVSFKIFGIVIDGILPIVVTYFAALTTTQLALAFGGNEAAGRQAIIYIIITATLGLIATGWRSIDQYVQALMRFKIEAKVSDAMYEHFLSLDFWQYDDKQTVDLYDRAQKFSQFFAYVFDRLAGVLSQFISLVFSLVALAIFLPWIALFVLLAVLPGVYLQFKLSRSQIQHWNKTVDTRRSRSFIEWNLLQPNSIAELRLNGLVRHLLDLRQSLRNKDEKARLAYERRYIGKRLVADGLEALTELGALLWIVLQIIAREQAIGQFIYVQQLVSRAFSGANGFVHQLSTIDEDLANLFDYQEFMNLHTKSKGGRNLKSTPKKVSFEDVSFRYPQTTKDVLSGISFDIHAGQHVAIVGENGAGKSTLIKLLTGLYAPSKGKVMLDDMSLQDISIDAWHKELSALQQDFEKYLFTDIQSNVFFGDVSHPISSKRIVSSLESAEALEFVHELPQKLKTYPSNWMEDEDGHKGIQLSGGQWQRIALARNFYRDATIIILDEPTSAIDALAENRIFKRLFAKSNKKTVVTISHRLSTIEKADKIIVLQDGRIVESGTHGELVAAKGQYYKIFEGQIEKA